MNSLMVAGVLGNDAEVKFLPDGTAICNFSIADSQGREKPTIWWRAQIWGKRAESSLPTYLVKGAHVTVTGTLTEREYTDRDGQKKKSQELRVQEIALQGGQRQQEAQPKPASQREQNLNRQHAVSRGEFVDDELPPF